MAEQPIEYTDALPDNKQVDLPDEAVTDLVFPAEHSLCESCGYPIKWLSIDAECPECGQAITESSPANRMGFSDPHPIPLKSFFQTAPVVLLSPSRAFREMRIEGTRDGAKLCLDFVAFSAALLWCLMGYPALRQRTDPLQVFLLCWLGIYLLTYLEMLGVNAICKRRGWRVDFKLAQRVCSYASVGWLPGALIASAGAWLLHFFAVGQLWFIDMLGLIRVSWLFYAGLFVSSLLWFETLVWIGIRQVKYANAWGPPPASDPADN